ncbi:MAG TPA: TonB family protein [Polyangiaceae bacterium]|nr:TonB family protein [Polyangiaceae bacterium]
MSGYNANQLAAGELSPGKMLGRYELLMSIANGGMGNVWAARLKGTRGFRKLFAVKTILRTFDDPRMEQMLYQEATVASQVHHPNVVETIELGEDRGIMFLVMELIQGESLSFILREAFGQGGVPMHLAVNLIGQVCRGLQAAHELCDEEGNPVGLVHRDISPPNILVTYSGVVKIVDFGVATTSSSATCGSGEIKGKISYLAPEQLRGDAIDGRVDVFTTGILLYLLTVGQHPFKAPAEAQTISRILSDEPAKRPSVIIDGYPAALEAVLMKSLAKNRDERFQSAAEFLEALNDVMPEAFGPNCDREFADYIRDLLKSRAQERRAALRMAEELAEKSSPEVSILSVPGLVAATPAPAAKQARRWPLFAGSAVLALGALITANPQFLQHFRGNSARVAQVQATLPAGERAIGARAGADAVVGDRVAAPRLSVDPPNSASAQPSAPSSTRPVGSNSNESAVAHRPAHGRGGRSERDVAGRDDTNSNKEEPAGSLPEASALASPVIEAAAHDDTAGAAEPVGSAIAIVQPLASAEPSALPTVAQNAPPTTVASPTKAEGPRMLPAKIAHQRLAINPNASAYRAELPPALERAGQSFSATVQICVSPAGRVTGVTILRSASPVVDSQILGALGRWRYNPMLESGHPVPFCYRLEYQVDPR